jgi:FMN phosphatase YigB (HAD superfamily)
MKPRAVIFDVYRTLLDVGEPADDPASRWEFLWQDTFADPPRISIEDFLADTEVRIRDEQALARAAGIPFPEIYWPAVVRQTLPEASRLTPAVLDRFLFEFARIQRTVRLLPDAARTIRGLHDQGVVLGIASNAQPYTLHEFADALAPHELSSDLFPAELCFWSFAHGFSKPDPHVFRLLTARLLGRGILAPDILMIGDRMENDIRPAQAQGWRTWHLRKADESATTGGGTWSELHRTLSLP